jgi:hypothetical protein
MEFDLKPPFPEPYELIFFGNILRWPLFLCCSTTAEVWLIIAEQIFCQKLFTKHSSLICLTGTNLLLKFTQMLERRAATITKWNVWGSWLRHNCHNTEDLGLVSPTFAIPVTENTQYIGPGIIASAYPISILWIMEVSSLLGNGICR